MCIICSQPIYLPCFPNGEMKSFGEERLFCRAPRSTQAAASLAALRQPSPGSREVLGSWNLAEAALGAQAVVVDSRDTEVVDGAGGEHRLKMQRAGSPTSRSGCGLAICWPLRPGLRVGGVWAVVDFLVDLWRKDRAERCTSVFEAAGCRTPPSSGPDMKSR